MTSVEKKNIQKSSVLHFPGSLSGWVRGLGSLEAAGTDSRGSPRGPVVSCSEGASSVE